MGIYEKAQGDGEAGLTLNFDDMERNIDRTWHEAPVNEFLSKEALVVGAGSSTDTGVSWVLPTLAEKPIVLAGGIPDPDTMPIKDLKLAIENVLDYSYEDALSYGGVEGYDGLRSMLARRQSYLDRVSLGVDNFVLNNGGAGSIDAICSAFLDPGEVVLVESPTFSGSIRTFKGHLANIKQIPLDNDGLHVGEAGEVISQVLREGRRPKLLYTIPDFQNPTGVTMTLDRRHELLDLCREHQILIIEDSAYTELYFSESVLPSLYSLAQGQGVLKVGSFSKIIATGLRVGWVQARNDFIQAISRVKFDMGASPLLLYALAKYLESEKLESHIDKMRSMYAEKCDVLCDSLETHCSEYVKFRRPQGGFFLWVECVGPTASEVVREAASEGLLFPAGAIFFLSGSDDDDSHIRLAFSSASVEELAEVGPRLKSVFQRALGEG